MSDDTVRIPLTHRKDALIDAEDLPRIAPDRWYAMRQDGRWFGVCASRRCFDPTCAILPPGTPVG
jgi:hypothetical protein